MMPDQSMWQLDLVLNKLLPIGGSEELIEAVLDADQKRIYQVLSSIPDLEKRNRLADTVKHLSAFLEMYQ